MSMNLKLQMLLIKVKMLYYSGELKLTQGIKKIKNSYALSKKIFSFLRAWEGLIFQGKV